MYTEVFEQILTCKNLYRLFLMLEMVAQHKHIALGDGPLTGRGPWCNRWRHLCPYQRLWLMGGTSRVTKLERNGWWLRYQESSISILLASRAETSVNAQELSTQLGLFMGHKAPRWSKVNGLFEEKTCEAGTRFVLRAWFRGEHEVYGEQIEISQKSHAHCYVLWYWWTHWIQWVCSFERESRACLLQDVASLTRCPAA